MAKSRSKLANFAVRAEGNFLGKMDSTYIDQTARFKKSGYPRKAALGVQSGNVDWNNPKQRAEYSNPRIQRAHSTRSDSKWYGAGETSTGLKKHKVPKDLGSTTPANVAKSGGKKPSGAPHTLQRGKKGGTFYMSNGRKIYSKKLPAKPN